MILPYFVQSPMLRSVPGIYHAFLGIDPQPGRGDAGRLQTVFSIPPSRIGTLRQIHSATVLGWEEVDTVSGDGGKREGDALWTAVRGTGIGVRTADCVPVLIANPEVPVCAVVHAGWRGLAAGIIGETVHGLGERFGTACDLGLPVASAEIDSDDIRATEKADGIVAAVTGFHDGNLSKPLSARLAERLGNRLGPRRDNDAAGGDVNGAELGTFLLFCCRLFDVAERQDARECPVIVDD